MISYKGCLIFVSQDYEILNTVANRIIEIGKTNFIDEESSFEDYLKSDRIKVKRQSL